jgi:transcriptional regulator with GAF, ATPase, and Fis domain
MSVEQTLEKATSRKRPIRPANHEAQVRALTRLARIMAEEPEKLPGIVTEMALELCSAGSAGISILEKQPSGEILRFRNVAGAWARFEGGTIPQEESPCPTFLDRSALQVYTDPAKLFASCIDLTPEIQECLVVPIVGRNQPLGTLWIVSHDSSRHFDSEDARLMSSFADFTGAALKALSETVDGQLSIEAASNRMHVQQLRTSCRAALDNYVDHARATCELAASYPLSIDELDELKERRDEEHNAYWKYMDVRQDLLNILVLDSEGTPDRFKG